MNKAVYYEMLRLCPLTCKGCTVNRELRGATLVSPQGLEARGLGATDDLSIGQGTVFRRSDCEEGGGVTIITKEASGKIGVRSEVHHAGEGPEYGLGKLGEMSVRSSKPAWCK